MTWADKIRALDAAGHTRAQIHKLLGKRYQHVRNVLEGDKLGRRSAAQIRDTADREVGVKESGAIFEGIHRLEVGSGGTVRLPQAVQDALGARSGGVLIGELQADRFVILSGRAAALKARALIQGLGLNPERMLSEELIAERRAESARDEPNG